MALASFVLIIELNEDGNIYCEASNKDVSDDAILMQLRGFIRDEERKYFEKAAANRTYFKPPK